MLRPDADLIPIHRTTSHAAAFHHGSVRGFLLASMLLLLAAPLQSSCAKSEQPAANEKADATPRTQVKALDYDHLPDWSLLSDYDYSVPRSFFGTYSFAGRGVSVSIDGDTAAVGSIGAVELFEWDTMSQTWAYRRTLTEPAGVSHRFGASVSISGDTLVVGSPDYGIAKKTGRVSIYERSGNTWARTKHIVSTNPNSQDNLEFGAAVVVRDDVLVVGAPGFKGSLSVPAQGGAIFTYLRSNNWAPEQEISPQISEEGDRFGAALALSDTVLAVGAPGDRKTNGSDPRGGRVYAYRNQGNFFSSALDHEAEPPSIPAVDCEFGASVAVTNDLVIVGAPGATNENSQDEGGRVFAYSYTQSNGLTPLSSAGITRSGSDPGERFGEVVVMDATTKTVAVTSSQLLRQDGEVGTVHVFDEDPNAANIWALSTTLDPSVMDGMARFGRAMAIDGGRLFVSAAKDEPPHDTLSGALYTYTEDQNMAGQWTLGFQKPGGLLTIDGLGQGNAVAIDGDLLAFSATPSNIATPVPDGKFPFVRTYKRGVDNPRVWVAQTNNAFIFEKPLMPDSRYGEELAFHDDYLFVSKPDAVDSEVFAYKYDGNEWSEVPDALSITNRADSLGSTMVTGDGWLALGRGDSADPIIEVHVYDATRDTWAPGSSPALPNDIDSASSFGRELAAHGQHLATFDEINGLVYVFTRLGAAQWGTTTIDIDPMGQGDAPNMIAIHEDMLAVSVKLANSAANELRIYKHTNYADGDPYKEVNSGVAPIVTASMALTSHTLAVGDITPRSPGTDDLGGRVTLFHLQPPGTWRKVPNRSPFQPAFVQERGYNFGQNIAMQDMELLIGSPNDSSDGIDAGSVLLFSAGIGCDAQRSCSSVHICDMTEPTNRCEEVNTCGNSRVEEGEDCDDGNLEDNDDCPADCRLVVEECNTDSDCLPGEFCNADAECEFEQVMMGCMGDEDCDNGATCNDQRECVFPNSTPNNTPGFDVEVSEPEMGAEYKEGEVVTVRGTTAPGADVELFLRRPGAMVFEQGSSEQAGSDGEFSFPLEKLPPGGYALRVAAKSDDVIVESEVVTFRVVADPRLRVGGEDVDSENPNEVTPGEVISGVASEGTNIIVTVNDTVVCNIIVDESGEWSCTLPDDVESGQVVVTDGDGNILGEFTISVVSGREDTLPPPDAGCTCSSSDGSTPSPAAPMMLFFALVLARLFSKRARRFGCNMRVSKHNKLAAILLVTSSMMAVGCSKTTPAPTQDDGSTRRTQQALDHEGAPYWRNDLYSEEVFARAGYPSFGSSVSLDGDRVAVGADGAVRIFEWDDVALDWREIQHIIEARSRSASFGQAVALDGNTLAIGAPDGAVGGQPAGRVFIYEESAEEPGLWKQAKVLDNPTMRESEYFGSSLALEGDRLVIGAPGPGPGAPLPGKVYLHERDQDGANAWGQVKSWFGQHTNDTFGSALALEGDWLMIGATRRLDASNNVSGAIEARFFDGQDWLPPQVITPNVGDSGYFFGTSVALEGTTLLVGAPGSDLRAPNEGMVYAYRLDGMTWKDEFPLSLPPSADNVAKYGSSVAIDTTNGRAFIGSPTATANEVGGNVFGAVYSWKFDAVNHTWTWDDRFVHDSADGQSANLFGGAIAADGGRLVATASGYQDASDPFSGTGGALSWEILADGSRSNPARLASILENRQFATGTSVAIQGDLIAIGSPGLGEMNRGSVAIYARTIDGEKRWRLERVFYSDTDGDGFGTSIAWVEDALVIGVPGRSPTMAFVARPDPNNPGRWRDPVAIQDSESEGFGSTMDADGRFIMIGTTDPEANEIKIYEYQSGASPGLSGFQNRPVLDNPLGRMGSFASNLAYHGNTAITAPTGTFSLFVFDYRPQSLQWTEQPIIQDPSFTSNIHFGKAFDFEDDLLAVSSREYDIGTSQYQGNVVRVFRRDAMTSMWSFAATIANPTGAANDEFGDTIKVQENTIFVSAPGQGTDGPAGRIYIFSATQSDYSDWGLTEMLTPPRDTGSFRFGEAIDVQGNEAVIGMPADDSHGPQMGSAFVFQSGFGCGDCSVDHVCDSTEPLPRCESAGACGNGTTENDEGCDDGARVPGDGCDENCLIEEGFGGCANNDSCATGLCNTNTQPNACVAPGCGNSVTEANEDCDDGNLESGDGCDATCRLEAMGCDRDEDCGPGEVCMDDRCLPGPGNNTAGFDVEVSEPEMGAEYKEGVVVEVRGTTAPGADVEFFLKGSGDDTFAQVEGTTVTASADTGVYEGSIEKLMAGTYILEVRAKSGDTIEASQPVTFRVVADPRLRVGGEDVDSENPNEVTPGEVISGVASEGTNIIVTVNDTVVCNIIVDESGEWSCTLPDDVESGQVVVTDGDGNILGEFTISVVSGREDTLPPPDAGCTCSSSDGSTPSPAAPMMLFFALVLARLFSKRARRFGCKLRMSKVHSSRALAMTSFVVIAAGCSQKPDEATSASPKDTSISQALDYAGKPYWDEALLREQELKPRVGTPPFGQAVAVDGNTLAISTRGTVRLFERGDSSQEWKEYQQIVFEGSSVANFGSALELAGDLLFIGTNNGTVSGKTNAGKVYIYEKSPDAPTRWEQTGKVLLAPTGEDNAYFGSSLSFAQDRLAIGAPGDASGMIPTKGRAYVFAKDEGGVDNWGHQATFEELGVDATERYGVDVSLSAEWLAIGADRADVLDPNSRKGAVYLYSDDGGGSVWSRSPQIVQPSNTGGQQDDVFFGAQVLIDDGDLFVGAPGVQNIIGQDDVGAVYHYTVNNNAWGNETLVVNPQRTSNEVIGDFGASLAFDKDQNRLFVGAPASATSSPTLRHGLVFSWVRDANQQMTPDGLYSFDNENQNLLPFGWSIAAGNGLLIASNPGYDQMQAGAGVGVVIAQNIDADGTSSSAQVIAAIPQQTRTLFGSNAAINGDLLAIGAPGDTSSGNNIGSVTIYKRHGGLEDQWERLQTFYSSEQGTEFGERVAWVNNVLVIGDPQDAEHDIYFATPSEVAMASTNTPERWNEPLRFRTTFQTNPEGLGASIDTDGNRILIGNVDPNADEILFYEYNEATSDFDPLPSLKDTTLPPNSNFGFPVALGGNTAAVSVEGFRVRLYTFDGSTWSMAQSIERVGELFGSALDIDGDLLVGTARATNNGRVYVFKRTPNTDDWDEVAAIDNPGPLASFGEVIQLHEDTLVISAPAWDGTSMYQGGYVYIYEASDDTHTQWDLVATLSREPREGEHKFGSSVGLQKGELVIGAPGANFYGPSAGVAYVYRYGIGCDFNADCGDAHVCDMSEAQARCEAVGVCGNGSKETGEDCDDGNIEDGDGCPSDCGVMAGPTCSSNEDCGMDEVCGDDGQCEPTRPDNNTPAGELFVTLSAPIDNQTVRQGSNFELTGSTLADEDVEVRVDFNGEGFMLTPDANGDFSMMLETTFEFDSESTQVSERVVTVVASLREEEEMDTKTVYVLPDRDVQVGDDDVNPDETTEVSVGQSISGYAIPNSRVIVELDGVVICDIRADGNGLWTCIIPEGARSGDIVVKDENGNILGEFTISVVSGREDTLPPPDAGCTCSSSDGQPPSPALPMLLFLALALARLFSKRARCFGSNPRMSRSGRVGLGVVAVAMTLLAACTQSTTAPTQPATPAQQQADETTSIQQPLDYEGDPYWDDALLHEEEVLPRMGYPSFGQAVALDGDTMAISTKGDVRLFEWDGGEQEWEEYQQIFFEGSDDANFGSALVLAGSLLFVGTSQAQVGATVNAGKVYMYQRRVDDPRRWERLNTVLFATTPDEEGRFGSSLAFDQGNDRLAVGAPGHPTLPSAVKGKVYIYARNKGGPDNWGLEQILEEVGIDPQDRFGSDVSIDGNWLAVGVERDDTLGVGTSTGSVYLYNYDGLDWLVAGPPLEPSNTGGQTDDIYFGSKVLLNNDELFIGAPGFLDQQGVISGMVYHYTRDMTMTWNEETMLSPPIINIQDSIESYGSALAFDQRDDRLFIGAPVSQYMGKRGMVFAMKRAGEPRWVVDDGPYITYGMPSSTSSSVFGSALAADDGFLISSAPFYEDFQDDTVGTGRVFSYEMAADGTATKERWIAAIPRQSNTYAGSGVALSRDLLAIAAPGDLGTMTNLGTVTIYKRQEDPMRRWRHAQTIYSPNQGTEFGEQLAWVKDILVIGDPQDPDNNFYMVRPVSGETDRWGPLEAVNTTSQAFAHGATMSSDGERLLVGHLDFSSTELLFFEYDEMTQNLAAKPSLIYGQTPPTGGRSFGHNVALDDNTAVVRIGDDEVLVYRFENGSWGAPETLPMVGTSTERTFDIDGDLIAINALDGIDREVRIYKLDPLDGEWDYASVIRNPDNGNTSFGAHIKVIDQSIIISAPSGDGVVYVYEPADDTYASWTSVKKVESPDAFETLFGVKFDAQKGEIAVGIPTSNAYEDQSGTTYVYRYGIDCAAGQCGGGHVCDTSEAPTRCEAVGTCGNGVQDAWETCDDGNLEDNDMCPSDCGFVALECIADMDCGEDNICEDNACRPANICGNGRKEMEETCDDGNTEDNDMCPANCGIVEPECTSDMDCPEDEVCNVDLCEAAPPNNTPAEWLLELSTPGDRETFRLGEEFEIAGVVTPGAYVSLLAEGENSEVLDFIGDIEEAETLASDGDFLFTLSGDDLGAAEDEVSSYTLKVIAEDTQNSENTDLEVERTIFILPNEEVKVGDDEVEPGEENEVTPGETLSGYAIPNSRVIVEIDGIVICDVEADDRGLWTCLIPEGIKSGDVVVKDEDGNILGEFTISVVSGREDVLPPPNPGCTCSSLDGSGPSPAAPLLLFLAVALARLFSKRARTMQMRSRVTALVP